MRVMIRAVELISMVRALEGDEEQSSVGMDLTRKALKALVQFLDLCGVDIANISHQIGNLVIFD